MATAKATIEINAKDNTKGTFKSISNGFKDLKEDSSGLAKALGGFAVAGVGAVTAFAVSAIKGFAEAEVSGAKVNATLDSMANKTLEVASTTAKFTSTLKVTGTEALALRNKIDAANIALNDKQNLLKELAKELRKGNISESKYKDAVAKVKNQIEGTSISIKEMTTLLGETDDAQGSFTKTVKITADQVEKAKIKIAELSEAAIQLGFDDEAAAESLAKLFQRTGDMTEAARLNAVAMDLSRAKSIDLKDASNILNMVLSGNVRALKEFGITADETKSPLENIAMLQAMVAGQATSFATTFTGQMAIISETWSNFKDGIGAALVEALMPFVKQFNAWLLNPETKKQFEEWTGELKSWANVIIPTIVETFKMWASAIKNVLEFLIKVGDKIEELSKPVAKFFSSINDSAKSSYDTRALTGRASGGTVASGTTYLVGESGPELFTAPSTGRIVPNSRLSSGGGNIIINITGTFGVNQDVAEQIGDMIIQNFKRAARI